MVRRRSKKWWKVKKKEQNQKHNVSSTQSSFTQQCPTCRRYFIRVNSHLSMKPFCRFVYVKKLQEAYRRGSEATAAMNRNSTTTTVGNSLNGSMNPVNAVNAVVNAAGGNVNVNSTATSNSVLSTNGIANPLNTQIGTTSTIIPMSTTSNGNSNTSTTNASVIGSTSTASNNNNSTTATTAATTTTMGVPSPLPFPTTSIRRYSALFCNFSCTDFSTMQTL